MPSHVEELHQLLERTDVLLQQTSGLADSLGPAEGTDESGQVTVRLDAHGLVDAVGVGFAWDSALSPETLAPAVLKAATRAQLSRLEQYGAAAERADGEPEPAPRAVSTDDALAALQDRTPALADDSELALAALETMLEETREGLEEAAEILRSHESRKHHGRSGPGHVRATVTSSGVLQTVEVDTTWARRAHPANLGREITEAVRRAVIRSQKEGLAAAMAVSRLARLAELTTGYLPPGPKPTEDLEETS